MNLFKEIKGVFPQPRKKFYFGKIVYGTPYFNPWNFVSTIIKCRKLSLKPVEKIIEYETKYPHLIKHNKTYKFSNYPVVHRSKEWVFQLFNSFYFLQIGWPIYI